MKNKLFIAACALAFATSCNKATNTAIPTANNANTAENADLQSTARVASVIVSTHRWACLATAVRWPLWAILRVLVR
jgi:hypothetical protein